MKQLGLVAAFLAFASVATATDQQPTRLEEMVVTATKTERSADSVPASVTVITKEQIKSMPAKTADELLNNVAGVYVSHRSGFITAGTSNSVRMRGLGGGGESYVQVQVDGVPVNDLQTGAVEWNEFPIQDIERIEIVRGPSSALYGNNAMGGVINIITKNPGKGMHLEASAGYGSLNTTTLGLRQSGGNGKLSYALGVNSLMTDGYVEIPPENRNDKNNADKDTKRYNLSAKLRYDFDPDTSLTYSGAYYHSTQTGKYTLLDGFNCYAQDTMRSNLNFVTKIGAADIKATVYGSDSRSSYDSASTDMKSTESAKRSYFNELGTNLQAGFSLGQHNYLTLGTDYRHGTLDTVTDWYSKVKGDTSGGKQDNIALFAQDEISLLEDKLILNIGARYDWYTGSDGYQHNTDAKPVDASFDKVHDSAFSPKLSVLYKLNDYLNLRTAVGKAFQTPALNKIYRGTYVLSGKTYISNPDLKCETLTSYEAGTDFKLNDRFRLSATYFHQNIKDCIYDLTVAKNTFKYTNASEMVVDGIEADTELRLIDYLSLTGSLTINHSKFADNPTDPTIEGNYWNYLPKATWSVGLAYDNPQIITLRVNGRRVGAIPYDTKNTQETGRFFVTDLMIGRKLIGNWSATLEVFNLFDKEYRDTPSLVNPGRLVMGTIKYSF